MNARPRICIDQPNSGWTNLFVALALLGLFVVAFHQVEPHRNDLTVDGISDGAKPAPAVVGPDSTVGPLRLARLGLELPLLGPSREGTPAAACDHVETAWSVLDYAPKMSPPAS